MRPARLMVAVAVLLGLAVGCGDDDSGDDAADSEPATESEPAPEPEPPTESEPADDQGAPVVEVAEDGSCNWLGHEVAAGFVDLEVVNNSSEPMAVNFAPLAAEANIDDVIAAAHDFEDMRGYHDVPSLAGSGQTTRTVEGGVTGEFAMAFTTPGDYAVACTTTEPTLASGLPTIAPVALRVVGG